MKHLLIMVLMLTAVYTGQTQRYKKLHKKALVADTHNDLLSTVVMKGMRIEDDLSGKAHSDFARFKQGGVDVQVFAIFCDSTFGKDTAFKFANIEIDSLYAIAARNRDKMEIVYSTNELMRVVKRKKLAGLIGVEGGHMIEDSMDNLDSLYKRGARYLTLTWNNSTSWATSSLYESTHPDTGYHKGLNEFGRNLVKRMNELGMMIDVSHVGVQTFYDVIKYTSKPVIASHSSAYSVAPHHRNLNDDQIRAVAKNGGVIQINFNSGFIDSAFYKRADAFTALHKSEMDSIQKILKSWEIGSYLSQKYPDETNALRPPISLIFDHIDHIVKLVGVDYVGLGSDFDGISSSPVSLTNVSEFPNITKGLAERGYSKKDIKKILGENFIRVFKANSM